MARTCFWRYFKFALLGIVVALTGCGGGSSTPLQPLASVKTSAPVAPDLALIPTDTVITLIYNASMDPSSLVLGGDMAGESDGGVWSTTLVANDTLTLSPTSSWTVRSGRTLTINAKDTTGRQARTEDLAYDIYRGALYYVNINQLVDNLGGMTPATAFKYIHTAVNTVSPPATILVAGGTYFVSDTASLDTRIWLRPNISLYGGYSTDFRQRDPAAYPSTIQDNTGAVLGTAASPNFAVTADNNYAQNKDGTDITNTTLVDGFIINGLVNVVTNVTGDYTTAIFVQNGAAPVFANNNIVGGLGRIQSKGIYTNNSSPTIYNNNVSGSYNGSNSSYGIYAAYASPVIINNMISGGYFVPNSTAYYLNNGSGVLRNNSIYAGSGTTNATAVALVSNITPVNPNIDNNIIFTDTGTNTRCITEDVPAGTGTGNATPASLRNNDLFACNVLYVDYEGACGGSNCTTVQQVNTLLTDITGGASNNVSVDPLFASLGGTDGTIGSLYDNDWHFSLSSPASVTAGGLNGIDEGWSFITDKDNHLRPAAGTPWSMGAYQR